MSSQEEDKIQLLEYVARELFIHKDLTVKEAFSQAQEFVDTQYDVEWRETKALVATCLVRYIVTEHNSMYGHCRTDIDIACTSVDGFKVMHERYKGRVGCSLNDFVEDKAREQLNEILKKNKARVGNIRLLQVDSFKGDF